MVYYQASLEGITTKKLTGFFQGWFKPETAEHHLKILQQSSDFLLALDEDSGQVVGSIVVLTDNVQLAVISLLEVLVAYQGQGIGSELVTRMLNKYEHLPAIDLMCSQAAQAFYERLGMKKSVGMVKRNLRE